MSEWLMEDELEYAELLSLYEEARQDVDRKYPRRGTNQADWILSKALTVPRFIDNWMNHHYLMSEIRTELDVKNKKID